MEQNQTNTPTAVQAAVERLKENVGHFKFGRVPVEIPDVTTILSELARLQSLEHELEEKYVSSIQERFVEIKANQEAQIKRTQAEVGRAALQSNIIHCSTCGGSWYSDGITAACPACEIGRLKHERDSWFDAAGMMSRNADYYQGLVQQIGARFGDAAKTADDGTLLEDVLCIKVPELVDARIKELTEALSPFCAAWETLPEEARSIDNNTVLMGLIMNGLAAPCPIHFKRAADVYFKRAAALKGASNG